MTKVREAHFRRVLDRGGQPFAEVEVLTDHPRNPQMLAYFRTSQNGDYSLVKLISNDADYEIDWYENNLHSAFDDVMGTMLFTPDHIGESDRKEFVAQILAYPGIAEVLDRNL
ncbi:hypothetical protein [Cohnella luojiensis]|uniref:Uncharacterized protein n=1 Tax=Cohnella luojiensis TaxID=652876 RepID=A0A4Y8M770_9BACL|nr:hypothetical protein [Cohnella luojiensis]TFE30665.1 hypothetical protein E2980_02455 [Cohnella luojiensis]